ncbi:MAG: HdeD family acid-resistance protein [Thermaurantiacus sp.]
MALSPAAQQLTADFSSGVKRSWWGFLLLGVLMVATGIMAMVVPVSATLGVVWLVAFLIIAAGVVQAIQAFAVPGWKGTIWQLFVGILKIAFGVYLVLNPAIGAFALTIFFGIIFIIDGFAKLIFGFVLRPNDGWGWILAAGMISLLLGVWVLVALGAAFAVVPGVLIGVALLFEGLAYLAIGWQARSLYKGMKERGLTEPPAAA